MGGSAGRISKRPESRPAGRALDARKVSHFRKVVWAHYSKQGRHDLPWRGSHDPYGVLVSEIMLQQTQVERVIPFYKTFLKKFPTMQVLTRSPLSEVLKCWQGLGYNRRAKMLHQAAKELVLKYNGEFPKLVSEIEKLPGIGPYTARAIAAFACNQDVAVIETNIRTAVINHFFLQRKKVSDTEIEKILTRVLPKGKAREWYSALMDYGAYLKRSGISHNARSRHYAKQSKFMGSNREVRGAIMRLLTEGSTSRSRIMKLFSTARREQIQEALNALCIERLVRGKNRRYMLAD